MTDLAEALKISAEFKKAVNDRYRLLEIDLDGVFKRLLLLQKKKYAALKVEEGSRTSIEVKGLDMKRREYCSLSKNVSQHVPLLIFNQPPNYDLDMFLIKFYLERRRKKSSNGSMNIWLPLGRTSGRARFSQMILSFTRLTPCSAHLLFLNYNHQQLGKNPEDYPDVKSQPHVQVALRIKAKGGAARAGDVIPYIFCVYAGDEKTTQAERARHPDEFRKAENNLKIGLRRMIRSPFKRKKLTVWC